MIFDGRGRAKDAACAKFWRYDMRRKAICSEVTERSGGSGAFPQFFWDDGGDIRDENLVALSHLWRRCILYDGAQLR